MTFEQKKEAAKVLARFIMNTMVEQNVPLEDCTEILGMTTAATSRGVKEDLNRKALPQATR